MKIEIGEWLIRSFRSDDVAALCKYANNPKIAIQLKDAFPNPYTEADAKAWLEYTVNADPECHFAIASRKELIGGIGIEMRDDIYRRSTELGYWLGEIFWDREIATNAVAAYTRYAFSRFDIVRIDAGVFEDNPASSRVLEKAGYRFEGRLRKRVVKHNRLLDELTYSILREDIAT